MNKLAFCVTAITCATVLLIAQSPAVKSLSWAFPTAADVQKKLPAPEIEGEQQIAGSTQHYTQKQIDDLSAPPDWFPDQHQPMPRIVKDGSANGGFACASCHLPTGLGHPESGDINGLSKAYFLQSMKDFKSGERNEPIRMTAIAKATSDADIEAAADYFTSLPKRKEDWVKVVEKDTVPKTFIGAGRMRFIDPDGGSEPIGKRIITVPADLAKIRERDPRVGFIAYVPVGSVERGKKLASGTTGKTLQCSICHGEGLQGTAIAPRIADIHPIYLVRELYDFKTGENGSASAVPMKAVVANLSEDDFIDLAAYAASLPR